MGRQRDGRRRVAAYGFEDDARRGYALLPQLLGHHESMGFVAHHHRCSEFRQAFQARDRVLQHRALAAREGQQLLRIKLPGQRPQARARATRQHHWDQHFSTPAARCIG